MSLISILMLPSATLVSPYWSLPFRFYNIFFNFTFPMNATFLFLLTCFDLNSVVYVVNIAARGRKAALGSLR
jgi:hypothetical protein